MVGVVCMRVDFFLFSRLILTFTMFGHKRVFVILCVKIFSQIVRHAMVFVVCVCALALFLSLSLRFLVLSDFFIPKCAFVRAYDFIEW